MYIKQQSKKRKQTNKKLGPKEKKEAINQTSSEEKVIVEAFQPKKRQLKNQKLEKKCRISNPPRRGRSHLPRVAG
jgi:dsDNA-specific endonuclease/ATPase MutS2